MNDCYLKKKKKNLKAQKAKTVSYENFVQKTEQKGFDVFLADGGQIKVDITDFPKIDMEKLFAKTAAWKEMS